MSNRPSNEISEVMLRNSPAPEASGENLIKFISACRRRWIMVACIAFGGAALTTLLLSLVLPRYSAVALVTYRAGTLVAADVAGGSSQSAADTALENDISLLLTHEHLQRVVDSFSPSAIAKLPVSKDPADKSQYEAWPITVLQLQSGLTITRVGRSQVISVTFVSSNPQKAAGIANRVVQTFIGDQAEQILLSANRNLARFKQLYPSQVIDGGKIAAELERSRAEGGLDSNLVFMSHAVPPERPSSPSLVLLSLIALIGFSILGAVLAGLFEQLDHGLHSTDEVGSALGVPCVGLVPQLTSLRSDRPHRQLSKAPYSTYSESIRSITAASLELGASETGSKVILVTSSLPLEGKTTLAVSLAAYAARIGKRVLLLDLDTRQPATLRELAGKPDADALNRLLGGASVKGVGQKIEELGFQYVPSPCSSEWPSNQGRFGKAVHLQFSFFGRISRRQFWLGFGLCSMITAALLAATAALVPWSSVTQPRVNGAGVLSQFGLPKIDFASPLLMPAYAGLGIAILIGATMLFALGVKRCHDLGRSGFWTLPLLVPILGFAWWIVELGMSQGKQRRNVYGPSPVAPKPAAVDLVTLLADDRMERLLARLRAEFDLVVIDGPPVLAVTEARVVANLVDKILFAVRWGNTRGDVAYNAMRSLQSDTLSGRKLSNRVAAVLTRVDVTQHIKFQFGDLLEFPVRSPLHAGNPADASVAVAPETPKSAPANSPILATRTAKG